ncbi:MAG: lasso peptide biosynthesis B2 protein [Polyangiales bacterium]
MLARHGHPSQIHVGVSRDAHGKIDAHAWVVCEGRIVVGDLPDLSRFVPLPALDH